MWDSKLFKAGVATLLFFLIILVGSHIAFVFQPIIIAVEVIFFSFLIAGALFYIMAPIVDWFTVRKLPRAAGIAIAYLLFVGIIVLLVLLLGPSIQDEFTALVESAPEKIDELMIVVEGFEESAIFSQRFDIEALSVENIAGQVTSAINNAFVHVLSSIAYLIDLTTSIFITIIIVPFLLYYMLAEKGSSSVTDLVKKLAPASYSNQINNSLTEMNTMLAAYVQGLGIVSLFVGILTYIGYLIIGLDFALVFALFMMITNIVPIIGPFIGAVPAAIVGLIDSPLMLLKVIIVIVAVQQLDSLLIRPQVVGRKLAISPLAVILVVIVAGRLWGLLGIILAVPIFTALKIVIARILEYIQSIRDIEDQKNEEKNKEK